MKGNHKAQFEEVIKAMASRFFLEESAVKDSLITVTNADASPDRKNVSIFFTVFPETKQKTALEFAKRKRSDFKEFLKREASLSIIPFVDFEIDFGERNRQNIDRVSNREDF